MFDASRPIGRLFCLLPAILVWIVLASGISTAQTPARTTISDVVYRADGTVAGGTLLISWPAFTNSAGQTIVAGTTSAVLGSGGTLSVQLVPNIGAIPPGTFYTVVYQLDDGTVKTEYWAVPTTSPTTIALVRTTPGFSGQPSQLATEQFVNTALSAKANDSAVVHLNGSETITGTKQFAVAPSLPAPVQPTDAVNKSYVDSAVTTSGSGSFVSKAGDTMTGPLTLPAERNDIKRSVYDRLLNAVITVAISVAITMHDRLGIKERLRLNSHLSELSFECHPSSLPKLCTFIEET